MSTIYCCANERRRAILRSHWQTGTLPILNCIDYLVVAAGDGPDVVVGQSTLTVYFLFNLPTSLQGKSWSSTYLSIQGGLHGATVPIISNHAGTNTLSIGTALTTDPGQYTLTLQVPDSSFDSFLMSIDFFFQSTSITNQDCQTTPQPPAAQPPQPQIDYLAKDYLSFRRLMLDRLGALSADWQERNPADVGMVLVEILAYAADQLSYYQDAVATEAYLGTVRKRISARRHARLLDYFMHEGCNARALVCVQLAAGSPNVSLPAAQTWFVSRCASQPIVLAQSGPAVPLQLLDSLQLQYAATIFEPLQDTTLRAAHNLISFYTWTDAQCCLPAGATQATLVDSGLSLSPGDILLFVEAISPQSGRSEDADPNHRYPVRLTSVSPSYTDQLTGQAVIDIQWHSADALPTSLTISTVVGGHDVADVTVALGNVVLVDNGLTIPAEALTPAAPTAGVPYRPALQRKGLTHRTVQTSADLQALGASAVLAQDVRAALPALQCTAPDHSIWTPVADLLHSTSTDLKFVVEVDDDGQASLRFGDGTLGHAAVNGLVASYRTGNGSAGNVPADAIYHIIAPNVSTIASVRNPLPAMGGLDPELVSEVQLNVPQAYRTQQRAITSDDYASIAQRFQDVHQAAGVWFFTGAYRTIFLSVLRASGQAVDAPFIQSLRDYLEPYRLTGTEIVIEPPIFVALDISLTVHLSDDALRSTVRDSLAQAFSDVILPSGQRGFFHPDNFGFGQPVYLGQVLAAIGQVSGVLWVDTSTEIPTNRFQRLGGLQNELASGKIAIAHRELARLGGIPGVASFGNLEFHLQGGL